MHRGGGVESTPKDLKREDVIKRAIEMFDKADANKDGVLSADERRAFHHKASGEGRKHPGHGEGPKGDGPSAR